MQREIYYTVSMKKGYAVEYIDPETLEATLWQEGPFKDPVDASVQFNIFAAKGKGTWLTPAGFKEQVQAIADDKQKLAEWNAGALSQLGTAPAGTMPNTKGKA